VYHNKLEICSCRWSGCL